MAGRAPAHYGTVTRQRDEDVALPEHPSEIAQVKRQVAKAVTEEVQRVADAEEGERDSTLIAKVFKLGRYAYLEDVNDGEIISEDAVRQAMKEACETNGLLDPRKRDSMTEAEFHAKFDRQWMLGDAKGRKAVSFDRVGDDFTTVATSIGVGGIRTEDRDVAEVTLPRLAGRLAHTPGMGWIQYRRTRGTWQPVPDAKVRGLVMQEVSRWAAKVFPQATPAEVRQLLTLRSDSKNRRVMSQLETLVLREDDELGAHPNLLCVGNGVVRLDTGERLPHDPALMLTKGTRTNYVPGAQHPDWNKVLDSLPAEKREWFQGRVGQGITGFPPPDDRVVFLRNSGSGAKSTFMSALQTALGEHMTKVPEKVLTANADAHSTEITELRGVRLAYVEELPEGAKLNVKRLKDIAGTDVMDGRRMYKDTIRWRATHTLLLTTNYLPRVAEVDHGTWRRLVMMEFPYTYVDRAEDITDPATQRVKDSALRPLMALGAEGRAEAVLAWAVDGARAWYASQQVMAPLPSSVEQDTAAWRGSEDLIAGFIEEHLTFAPGGAVFKDEMYEAFARWQTDNGRQAWSVNKFMPRFEQHELVVRHRVESRRVRNTDGVDSHPEMGMYHDRRGASCTDRTR